MKKIGTLLCFIALAASCTSLEEKADKETGNPDLAILPPKGENDKIDQNLFTCINLDYPGLENVREYYSQGEFYRAAAALLDYYRNRNSVINPNVNLMNPSLSKSGLNIADQALDYRFYIRNYREKVEADGTEIYYSFKGENGKINWKFEPTGVDKEFSIQKHRHQWMLPQAQAYRATGNEEYVKSWITVYKDWLAAYPCPEGKINYEESMSDSEISKDERDQARAWTGLQSAERLLSQLDMMLYYLPSENFTPEWLAEFLVVMNKTAENIIANPVSEENSNIRLAQDQAISNIAMLMPEFRKSQEWLAHGSREISRHLNHQFNEDGVQNELDPSYHMGVIGDFLKIYNTAKMNNCLDKFPTDYVDKLKNACKFLTDVIFPNYTIDNFNDTRSSRMSKRVLLRNIRQYSSMFPDDVEMGWMASEGKTEKPSSLVKKYAYSGWYMMRNGWEQSSMMLIHKNNFNPANKWHCQSDNGTISIYNNGRCFTPDAGVYSYGGTSSSNADRKAFASTVMHNTITKNKLDIPYGHSKGKLLKSQSTANYELIVTENQSYDDFAHRRAIYMVDRKFYVLVDEAYGTADNIPAVLNFSLCRDLSDKGKAENVVVADDLSDSHVYGVHTEFEDGNNMLFRTFTDTHDNYSASEGTCYYSDDIGKKLRRKRYQVSISKKSDMAARFITVILPFEKPESLRDLTLNAKFTDTDDSCRGRFNPSGAAVRVTVGENTYELSYLL